MKKTDVIVQAFADLQQEGVAFTFELIENRPNDEVLAALANADILIDQIGSAGGFGRLSLEGLASGCAVVGCNNASVPYPPRCPIIRGIAGELTEQLRILCTNRDLRIHLAAEGRAWMLQGLTAPRTIAQRMIEACEGTLPLDYYPTAFMELCQAPPDEPLPPNLTALTLTVLQTYGCHPDANLLRLVEQGLLPQGCEPLLDTTVPRWDARTIHEVAPWAWCGTHIAPQNQVNTLAYHLRALAP